MSFWDILGTAGVIGAGAAGTAFGGPMGGAAATAAAQALKSEAIDKPKIQDKNRREANLAATQTQFSPWTGAGYGKFSATDTPDTIGSSLQAGIGAYQQAQAYNKAEADAKIANEQGKMYENFNRKIEASKEVPPTSTPSGAATNINLWTKTSPEFKLNSGFDPDNLNAEYQYSLTPAQYGDVRKKDQFGRVGV